MISPCSKHRPLAHCTSSSSGFINPALRLSFSHSVLPCPAHPFLSSHHPPLVQSDPHLPLFSLSLCSQHTMPCSLPTLPSLTRHPPIHQNSSLLHSEVSLRQRTSLVKAHHSKPCCCIQLLAPLQQHPLLCCPCEGTHISHWGAQHQGTRARCDQHLQAQVDPMSPLLGLLQDQWGNDGQQQSTTHNYWGVHLQPGKQICLFIFLDCASSRFKSRVPKTKKEQ
jgi:hypothetical protein